MTDPERPDQAPKPQDDVPRGRARAAQGITVALIALTIVIAIFVLQNTQDARVSFIAWDATLPLAAALLLAIALGALAGFLVAYIRQRQYVKALRGRAGGDKEGDKKDADQTA